MKLKIIIFLIIVISMLFIASLGAALYVKEDVDIDDLDRQYHGYPVYQTQTGHIDVCRLSNGTYFVCHNPAGGGLNVTYATNLFDFNSSVRSESYKIFPSGGEYYGGTCIAYNGSLYYIFYDVNGWRADIWQCNESECECTDSSNWWEMAPGAVGGYNPCQRPGDPCLYMFDEPVNGHRFWITALEHSGPRDQYRYVFYSDDPTLQRSSWTVGNNGNPIWDSGTNNLNWPAYGHYYEEAGGWIFFKSNGTNNFVGNLTYGYALDEYGGINRTWNKTSTVLIPFSLGENPPYTWYANPDPCLLVVGDRLYCYYDLHGYDGNPPGIAKLVSFKLSAFLGGQDDSIQFIDINGGTNGTTIYDSTPVFNWTSINNAIQYHLQVATDSTFTNLVVNISNINEVNYPTEYDEGTNVSFILPDANALSTYDTYYCRVKAYVV